MAPHCRQWGGKNALVDRLIHHNADSAARVQGRHEVRGLAEIIVAKNRSGPVGIVPMTWRSEYMRFENFSRENIPEGIDSF